jgi:hypothetical protein
MSTHTHALRTRRVSADAITNRRIVEYCNGERFPERHVERLSAGLGQAPQPGLNPRCAMYKTEPPFTGGGRRPGAMFHPAHHFGPCDVTDEGIPCGCTAVGRAASCAVGQLSAVRTLSCAISRRRIQRLCSEPAACGAAASD